MSNTYPKDLHSSLDGFLTHSNDLKRSYSEANLHSSLDGFLTAINATTDLMNKVFTF